MRPLVLILALCWLTEGGFTDRCFAIEGSFPESGTVIVTASGATAQIADEDPRPIPTATVLQYSRTNDNWLWIDSLWGWIDRSEVVLLDNAESHYTKMIEAATAADEPTGVALHQRGIARLAMGKTAESLADFEAAIDANYLAASVYINRGQALALLGRNDEALESLTAAIAKDPKNGIAYDARAVVLASQDFLQAAFSDANRAVELAPKNARVWYDRGLLHQRDGKFRAAVNDYNKSLEISPRYVEAVTNRGFCLKRLDRFEDAAKDYKKALEIAPNLAIANNDYAWLLATSPEKNVRNPRKAIKLAELAVKLSDNKNGLFLDTLAAAHAAAKNWKAAEKAARAAVELLDGADQYAADQRLQGYLKKEAYVEE